MTKFSMFCLEHFTADIGYLILSRKCFFLTHFGREMIESGIERFQDGTCVAALPGHCYR